MNGLLKVSIAAALAAAAPQTARRRPPAVAGQFYPAEPRALGALVEGYLKDAGTSPEAGPLLGLLVPHAGLEFSGRTAAKAYKQIKPGAYESVIVLGTAHYKAVKGAALYPGDYGTPDGALAYDEALARDLMKASPLIAEDAQAHEREHSIEVQIPFLRRVLPSAKLVALVMNTDDLKTAQEVGRALARVVKGRRILLIASSDQSHYPPGEIADAVDKTTLESLRTLDSGFFWQTNSLLMGRGLRGLEVSYCGQGAVAAVLEACRALGATEAKILGQTNSGEAVPQAGKERTVGYAAVAFVKVKGEKPDHLPALTAAEKQELLGLARQSIGKFLASGRAPDVGLAREARLNLPAAVFVTLTKRGELRGCIGTLEPRESLAESVSHNAIASAVSDRRFSPLSAEEEPSVRIEISILSPLRKVRGVDEIRQGDGVIVERGGRSGIFLPQVWKQIPEKEAFLRELCTQKAGLDPGCAADPRTTLKVFSVESIEEP